MKALLLILALAMPAGAQQVFPSDIKDPDVLRNMEFLLDQYNILRSSMANNSLSPANIDVPLSTSTRLCTGNQTPSAGENTQGSAATVAGSTLTISFSTNAWVEASVSLFHIADATQYNVDLYVDGSRPSWVGSNGALACQGSASSIIGTCAASIPVYVSSGSHAFYLKIWRGGNPVTLQMSNPCSYFSIKKVGFPQ